MAESIRKFKEKLHESHDDIEHFFNKEVKGHLSQSEIQKQTPEECRDLSNALTEALLEIEENANYTQTTVKDMLQKATIHALNNTVQALDKELTDCKCKNVLRREEQKKAQERPKRSVDSGNNTIYRRDSRVKSDPGNAPVVQPSDASDDKVKSNADNKTDSKESHL